MSSLLAQHRDAGRRSEQRSQSGTLTSEGLSSGTVQELQGEIAALRDVLSAMNVVARVGVPESNVSEVLPGYDEACGGPGEFGFSLSSSLFICISRADDRIPCVF